MHWHVSVRDPYLPHKDLFFTDTHMDTNTHTDHVQMDGLLNTRDYNIRAHMTPHRCMLVQSTRALLSRTCMLS